jgi:LmbE family N-acetylglucosaminyl deacetylase
MRWSRGAAPLFVVSPHLDDAVFSCGMLLASHPGSIVCTVFCGEPLPPQKTDWDRRAGHRDSSDALRSRVAEDERALSIVGAHAIRLPFLDSQYGATPPIDDLVQALTHAWRKTGSARLVAPLGLFHSDHLLVGDACRSLVRAQRPPHPLLYEDALYRAIRGLARRRCEALANEGFVLTPLDEQTAAALRRPGAANAKWRAVHAYRSQLRAFDDAHPHDLVEPERYVVIDRAPPAQPSSRRPAAW